MVRRIASLIGFNTDFASEIGFQSGCFGTFLLTLNCGIYFGLGGDSVKTRYLVASGLCGAFFAASAGILTAQSAAKTKIVTGEHWVATWGAAQTPARVVPPPGAPNPFAGPPAPGGAPGASAPAAPPPASAAGSIGAPAPGPAATDGPGAPARGGPPPQVSSFNNQTVRMTLRTTIGGDTVRIRLYNTVGAQTLKIGAAHIAKRSHDASASAEAAAAELAVAGVAAAANAPNGARPQGPPVNSAIESAIDPSTDKILTFSGQATATLYAGEVLTSDPVKLDVAPLSELVVSLFLPEDTGPPTTHPLGLRPTFISGPGDFAGSLSIDATRVARSYYWLEGVDVLAPADAGTIVTFGDSITDGDRSTPGKDAMWPAILAKRLQGSKGTQEVAVVNEGIAGNRVLGDNVGGLARFEHEALDVPGVKWITVLEGINDISFANRLNLTGEQFSAETLIAAYQQMIETAHSHAIKVIGCTITPDGGSTAYKDTGEAIRKAVNDWIRTSGAFDAVVDFDKVTRDASDPAKFSAAAGSPDMLHPGDPGYKMMGDVFDLKLFAPQLKRGAASK